MSEAFTEAHTGAPGARPSSAKAVAVTSATSGTSPSSSQRTVDPCGVADTSRAGQTLRGLPSGRLAHSATDSGRTVRLDGGAEVAVAEEVSGPVFAAVRPESVALFLARPEGSPRNVWPLRLAGAVPHGMTVRCELAGAVPLVADVTATAFAELGLAPGSEVWAAVKASEVAVYAR